MSLLVKDIRKRWPGNCLVYSYDRGISNAQKASIGQALQNWADTDQVHSLERTVQDRYITFIPDSNPLDGVCSSSDIGMAGGQQFIRLDPVASAETIRHEVGHALGFYHEHKRRDRAPLINVNTAQIKDIYRFQFERVAENEAWDFGSYDLDSIMHYGSSESLSLDGNTALITTDDPADSGRIGSLVISAKDYEGAARMAAGNKHIYQISGSGQIETVVEQNSWNSGWTIAVPYTLGVHKFMFLLKTSDGTMHIHRLNLEGSIGERIQTADWKDGWTHAVKYDVLGSNYFTFYKQGNGTVHTHKINADGTIGEKIDDGPLEKGWNYVAHFSMGTGNFLLLSNLNGDVSVYEIKFDGKIGQRKHAQSLGKDYTVTHPYHVLSNTFLFMLKKTNGSMKIRRINADGSIGDLVQESNWSSGWTTALPFHIGVNTYLFCLKESSGVCHIDKIDADGKVGSPADRRILKKGWGTAAVYGVGSGTYVLLVNP